MGQISIRCGFWLGCALALLPAPSAAYDSASARTAARPGFVLPADGALKIVILQQKIDVGEHSAGGVSRPHADWTVAARKGLAAAATETLASRRITLLPLSDGKDADATPVHDYRALFDAVAQSVISYKLLPDDRLPTKRGLFDWTLGAGTAQFAEASGADYALFYGTTDSYPSQSRERLDTLNAAFGGEKVDGEHRGYAALVDIRTGDLLWFKVDVRMSGDVRTAEGAKRRAGQLFASFPKRGEIVAGEGN